MSLYANLKWNDGQINPSGIKTRVFYTPKTNIAQFPAITEDPSTPAENVTLDGDFVMKAGKTFFELYSTQSKGKVMAEPIGEKDHKMFMNKGSFKFPDISDEAKSLAKQSANSNLVIVVLLPHEKENRAVVIGEEDYDTTVTIRAESGDAPGSEKGLFIEIEAPSTTPLPSYKGVIALPDGTYDCDTGVFTPTPTP
ncbi:MAG TPA: hypothetical protein PKE03_10325 [Bacteroidales bacterium]|nr:hypothetical protein [Bacteroidales bacterium]